MPSANFFPKATRSGVIATEISEGGPIRAGMNMAQALSKIVPLRMMIGFSFISSAWNKPLQKQTASRIISLRSGVPIIRSEI